MIRKKKRGEQEPIPIDVHEEEEVVSKWEQKEGQSKGEQGEELSEGESFVEKEDEDSADIDDSSSDQEV